MRNTESTYKCTGRGYMTVMAWQGGLVRSAIFSLLVGFSGCAGRLPSAGVQISRNFKISRNDSTGISFLLFLPRNYDRGETKWPMILFLHDSGEGGYDVNRLRSSGMPKLLDAQTPASFVPAIVVSPQCPVGDSWSTGKMLKTVDRLLNHLSSVYSVDTSRICVTGIGMGGTGAWALAEKSPSRFAAIAPVEGSCDTAKASALKALPVWAFCSSEDSNRAVRTSTEMVEALRKSGGDARLTVFSRGKKSLAESAYSDWRLFSWLLNQRTSYNRDPFVRRGLYLMAVRDSIGFGEVRRSVRSLEESERCDIFIDSPFRRSRFYLYSSTWMSPPPHWFMCSYGDTMVFVPPFGANFFGYPGPDDSTVAFLNSRLAAEPEMDSSGVVSLGRLYASLMAGGLEYKVLDSWKGIDYEPGESPSDRLKEEIRPPYLARENGSCRATLYVWFVYGRGLYKILLYYRDGRIKVDRVLIGLFGKQYFRL